MDGWLRRAAPFETSETLVPWTGVPATVTKGVRKYLVSRLHVRADDWLPERISLLIRRGVLDQDVAFLLEGILCQAHKEIVVWKERCRTIVERGLATEEELNELRRQLRGAQRWTIYVSPNGGLDVSTRRENRSTIVPCSGARHHGVSSWRDQSGRRIVSQVTSREEGRDWNWDADIGHECTHAAFGPVPLFTQHLEKQAQAVNLAAGDTEDDLSPAVVARICYLATELAVTAIRAEQRFTPTGLPGVRSAEELLAFVDKANVLASDLGFEKAGAAVRRSFWPLPVYSGGGILELGLCCMRFVARLVAAGAMERDAPPRADWFANLSA